MAGKCLRRLSLLALCPLLVVLFAPPVNAAQGAPSTPGAGTELLSPAITLDKTTGPFTVAEALGRGSPPRPSSPYRSFGSRRCACDRHRPADRRPGQRQGGPLEAPDRLTH